MAEGWLPPTAPGAKPPPRFDAPEQQYAPPEPPQPQPSGPTFVRPGPAAKGKSNRAALWGIWLGITGVALLVLSLGTLFPITLPLSAIAWVLARKALREIESGATAQGEGQATAALWLARIGVIAGVAAFVIFIVLIAAGFDFEQFRDDLERELEEQRRERDGGGDADRVRTAVEQLRALLAR
jgi:hypothetical protein